MRTVCLCLFICALFLSNTLLGQGIVTTDTTPGTAVADGTVNAGEYIGGAPGIYSGFGDVIGFGSILTLDSDDLGNVNIGLITGGGVLSDQIAIYIDAVPGGFGSTTGFVDNADGGRANISAMGFFAPSGRADITFAPGFEADYAISIESGFAGIFELVNGGLHNFVGGAPPASALPTHWEISFNLSALGLSAGDSFDYFATYGNVFDPAGFFRSDEFIGVSTTTIPFGNIGIAPTVLAAGDFNTFVSAAPPPPIPTLSEWGLILLFLSLMTIGTLYLGVQNQSLALKGVNGKSVNIKVFSFNNLPFEAGYFKKSLGIAIAVAIGFLLFFQLYFGEITNADWLGMFLAVPIFAYMIHLMFMMEHRP